MTKTYPNVSFRLDGEVALVTGGASGIGQAIAIAVAEHGAAVGVVDLATADMTSMLDAIATLMPEPRA